MSNNPPEVIVELTLEQAEFLVCNCDSNIGFGLGAMESLQEEANLRKLVGLMEQFKAIKKAVQKGMK